eukprot:512105-Amphidinium_carterae.1
MCEWKEESDSKTWCPGWVSVWEIALHRFKQLQANAHIQCWDDQYIDDGVLECHSTDAMTTYANLEPALGPSGLTLNVQLWQPLGIP